MPRAKKVCATPGCPTLTDGTRCQDHEREADRARGTRERAGHSTRHDQMRVDIKRRLAAGERIPCARCGQPVGPDFHLDHTDDRTGYLGPSHPACNLRAAGLAAHGLPWSPPTQDNLG